MEDPGPHGADVPLRVAAGLYCIAMLIFLSPVVSEVSFDGQVRGDGDLSSVCGLTLTSAFVQPGEGDSKRARKADCAAKASDRIGYGFLAVAFAAPATAFALAGRRRSQS